MLSSPTTLLTLVFLPLIAAQSSSVNPLPASTVVVVPEPIQSSAGGPVIIIGSGIIPIPLPTISLPPTDPATDVCVCINAPCLPCSNPPYPIPSPQTIVTTRIHTVTACSPNNPSCPYGSHPTPPVYTIYTTAYVDICPTGITTNIYTITHNCGEAACRRPAPTVVPQGYTAIQKVCDKCPGQPTLTVTCPVETGYVAVGKPTGTPYVPAPPTDYGSAGCGYGKTCPQGNGTTGTLYVTAGSESVIVSGLKVLLVCGIVGVLGLMHML